jgi:hypothetical protein
MKSEWKLCKLSKYGQLLWPFFLKKITTTAERMDCSRIRFLGGPVRRLF